MKKFIISVLVVALFLVCLLFIGSVTYRFIADRAYLKKVRPDGVTSVTDFILRFPKQDGAYLVERAGPRHVVLRISAP
jgi:hypothetical protein